MNKNGNLKMKITSATKQDASLIADAILAAVGPDIVNNLAGSEHTVKDIHDLFQRLASREDSQYSYLNSRIAKDENECPMGVCISYDGADLKRLRIPFFEEANKTLGWGLTDEEIDSVPGETSDDEFYLDTLMTLPDYRGKGVAKSLIKDAKNRSSLAGKPLGLLCDQDNSKAGHLYKSLGFKECGLRPFAGHDMIHMQLY